MSAESVETQISQLKGLSGTGESSELSGANRVSLSRSLDVCIAAARQEKLGLRGTPGTGLRPKCGGGPVEPLGALAGKRARASRRARVLDTAQGARVETRPGWLTADSALLSPLLGVGEPDPPPSLSGGALSPPPRTLPSPSGRAAPARLALDSEPRQSPRSLDPQTRSPRPAAPPMAASRWPGIWGRGVPGAGSYFYKMRQWAEEEEPAPGPIVWALRGRGRRRRFRKLRRARKRPAARGGPRPTQGRGRGGAIGAGRGPRGAEPGALPPLQAGGGGGGEGTAGTARRPRRQQQPGKPTPRLRLRGAPREREQPRGGTAQAEARAWHPEPQAVSRGEHGQRRERGGAARKGAERAGAGGGRRARASRAAAAEAASRETKARREKRCLAGAGAGAAASERAEPCAPGTPRLGRCRRPRAAGGAQVRPAASGP